VDTLPRGTSLQIQVICRVRFEPSRALDRGRLRAGACGWGWFRHSVSKGDGSFCAGTRLIHALPCRHPGRRDHLFIYLPWRVWHLHTAS